MFNISDDVYIAGSIPANATSVLLHEEGDTSGMLVLSDVYNTTKLFLDDLKR